MFTRRARPASLASLALVASLVTPTPARADDGYFLRGAGAVSDAMGGTGVAYSGSLLGAFALNPAGLARFGSPRFEVGLGMFRPRFAVSSTLTLPHGERVDGRTESAAWNTLPAVAFVTPLSGRVVAGVAVRNVSGFGVDYAAADPDGAMGAVNPVLLPQPLGIGEAFSDYAALAVSPALAWRINDQLWLGVNATLVHASLELRPVPFAAFEPPFENAPAVYPATAGSDGAFGTGMGVGLTYHSGGLYAAFHYQTPTWFETFEWDAVWPAPTLIELGAPETVRYKLNHPAVAGFGVAWATSDALVIEVDARRIMYGSTVGLEIADEDPSTGTGALTALGWQSIWTWSVGGQFGVGDKVRVRVGYGHQGNPVPGELTMANVATPNAASSRISAGLGLAITTGIELDAAYVRQLAGEQTGPLRGTLGTVASGAVTNEVSQDALTVQLSFRPGSR